MNLAEQKKINKVIIENFTILNILNIRCKVLQKEQKFITLRELYEGTSTSRRLSKKYQMHFNYIFNRKK